MKSFLRFFIAILTLILVLPLTQCKKDDDKDKIPPVEEPRKQMLDKWWYNNQGLGDYKFKSDSTYEYVVPWATTSGQYMWYNNLVDSMRLDQTGGGMWTIWFHKLTKDTFIMSQSNENHQNMYLYTLVEP